MLDSKKIPEFKREYPFSPPRKWKFDFAFISQQIAIEIEGGVWTRGRHIRPSGFIKDMEKYNTATKLGWKVFRFTGEQINSGTAIQFMEDYFCQ